MVLLDQSSGIMLLFQMHRNRGCQFEAATAGPFLNNSVFRLFNPGAFPFLRDLIAVNILSTIDLAVAISRSLSAYGISCILFADSC